MNLEAKQLTDDESINAICGVLVHSQQHEIESVNDQLTALTGVEVHTITEEGRMIVTIENEHPGEVSESLMKIQLIKGVVSASLVYQYSDAIQDVNEEVTQ